ncbi:MAG: DUF2635 domain-containing protein [Alphaproteobacteria bacterium]|nr:DUF2635 domain-containing protein [Alphaproteobacteria bacterium]
MSEPKSIFVRPNAGVKVFDPATKGFLPEEGLHVVASTYWLRRINDGDVSVVTSAALKSTVKPSNKKDA